MHDHYKNDATYEHGNVCIDGAKVTDAMLFSYCTDCRERIIQDMTVLMTHNWRPDLFPSTIVGWD